MTGDGDFAGCDVQPNGHRDFVYAARNKMLKLRYRIDGELVAAVAGLAAEFGQLVRRQHPVDDVRGEVQRKTLLQQAAIGFQPGFAGAAQADRAAALAVEPAAGADQARRPPPEFLDDGDDMDATQVVSLR